MSSFVPDLDDMDFDRLVEEGRGLIPRYAPDWTDHNLHDPGITLIDLIAYLTDRQIYRIGFVGDSLLGAFTRLMGVTPEGPRPARVLVWPRPEGVGVLDFQPGIAIETPDVDDAHWTLDAHVRTVAPTISDIAAVGADGTRRPLGPGLAAGRDPLPLLPYSGGGPRSIELLLTADIRPLEHDGFVSLGVLLESAAPVDVDWEPVEVDQWHDAGYWRPLQTLDLTGGLANDGAILFRTRDTGAANRFRIRLDAGFRPATVTLVRVGLNVLPATEGQEVPDTVLADSTGLPDQVVELKTDDLVEHGHLVPPLEAPARPFTILTNDGETETKWTRVASLDLSGPDDAHFRVTPGGLLFGNGLNGRIPPAGNQIRHQPLRRTAGAEGAVAKNLDWRVSGVTYGRNLTPSTAGRNGDTLADLVSRARAVAKGRDGFLPSEALAIGLRLAALGLQRVDVTPRRRPGREDAVAHGSRTILVLPTRDADLPPRPADTALLARIEAEIAEGRLLGERLHVSPPMYREVDVAVALVVAADAEPRAVSADAERLLRQRLWDLARSPGQTVAPWPAGRPVTVGEIETLMGGLEPVIRVTDCRIAAAGAPLARSPIALDDREIALARELAVTAVRNEEGTP